MIEGRVQLALVPRHVQILIRLLEAEAQNVSIERGDSRTESERNAIDDIHTLLGTVRQHYTDFVKRNAGNIF